LPGRKVGVLSGGFRDALAKYMKGEKPAAKPDLFRLLSGNPLPDSGRKADDGFLI